LADGWAPAVVHLPRSLVSLFPGTERRMECRGATVAEVIADLDARVPGIRNRLVDAGPVLRTHLNVFVAGEIATLDTPVPPGATVHVIPAVSGGADRNAASRVPGRGVGTAPAPWAPASERWPTRPCRGRPACATLSRRPVPPAEDPPAEATP
jgi:molybdopterin converting factor small subunit